MLDIVSSRGLTARQRARKREHGMKYNQIKVAYGWCAKKMIICPTTGSVGCRVTDEYFNCTSFRKCGEQSAIEEINCDGKRRVYLATSQADAQEPKTKKRLGDSSSRQAFLVDRVS